MGNQTIMPGVLDSQQTPLYDTYVLAAAGSAPNSISFFNSRTKGASGRAITNIEQAGQIAVGNRFTVFAMGFVLIDGLLADLHSLMKKYSAVLNVAGKDRLEAPIEFFPGGAGVAGFAATTASTTTVSANSNGVPSPTAMQMLSPENAIVIEGGIPFYVQLGGAAGFTVGANELFLRCYLVGTWQKFVS